MFFVSLFFFLFEFYENINSQDTGAELSNTPQTAKFTYTPRAVPRRMSTTHVVLRVPTRVRVRVTLSLEGCMQTI